MASEQPGQTLLSLEAFRRLVGAAPGELEDLIARGVLHQPQPGQIALVAGVAAFLAHLRARARDATLSRAATAARDARAEASELALAVARRDAIPDDQAEAAADFLCATITRELSGLPARATRDLRARAAIDQALRQALVGIADELTNS
ncbi:hypothetical protein D2N39_13065 [Gemmobacter lutimaris]|uniref:Uncharacterized protein n=1 Tax=Gemmobacter lutimaris TaxID=2306023 RepID=A0A398BRV7_9RHOB|nr:hypothetical protein [Gemmobacter lutimaris]RID91621.1 hypothetical protein D2N39_13065 [Gemmobacter lutimaris]